MSPGKSEAAEDPPSRERDGRPSPASAATSDYTPPQDADSDVAARGQGVDSPPRTLPGSRKTDQKVAPQPSSPVASLPAVPGYEILGELGRGGMGVVFQARDLQLERLVALKMILPGHDLSATRLERFLTEARAVARFQHPHLVQIYEIGAHDGKPYFSMEFLEGGSLSGKLKGTPQPAAEAAALLETLARAVDYAHQKGIVHRDLKPANILLMADGTPKIADFGLAKQLDQEAAGQTQEGGIVGTPAYMAPEQAWGQTSGIGPGADIYALGALLYELLTGRPPFQAANKWQTVELVRNQEPVPPRRLVPQVPRDLELICLKCLNKDVGQRFAGARDLAEELRRFQEGRPIRTRPTPFWEQAWKWTRRQPAVASLMAVSVVALLSLVLYLGQLARVAQRELREQQRTSDMRDKVRELRLQAQEASERGLLPDAQGHLRAAFEILHAEPALADLHPSLAALQTDVARREAEQQGQRASEAAYQQFFRLRDSALFHGMVLTGVDLPGNVAATKKACREALGLFGVTAVPARGPVFTNYLSAERRQQATVACYELLLVWAEAEAQPEPGRREPTRSQLEEAVRLVDRAAQMDLPATGAYHLRRAGYLELLGEADAARRERQLATTAPTQGALDYFLTGVSHQRQGQLAEAVAEFTKALRAQPDHFWARYFLAVCDLQLQRPAQARDHLTACLTARGDFLWLYLLRGFANGQLNEFRDAKEDYRRALALQPDPQALYGIRVNQGVLCTRQAQRIEGLVPLPWPLPRTPDLASVARGVAIAYRQERLTAAAGYLTQAIRLQPDQYPAYRYLALVLQRQQRLDEAVALLDEALRATRDREPSVQAQLYGQRARLHRERHDWDAALDDLDRSLRAFPSAADHAERGRVLYARRQYQEAVAAYDAALRLPSAEAEICRLKAEALLVLQRDREAVAALDQYLAKGGLATAEVYRSRGLAHARLRQFQAALADYTQVLARQPDSATHASRGWILLANEVLPLALQDFEAAIRLDAENAEAYAGRGLIRVRLGQPAQARADAEAALRHGRPETPRLLWNTAHVYAQLVSHPGIEPRASSAWAAATRERYQDQALEVLRRALERVPAGKRAAFWRRYVASDALLNPLRGHAGFDRLEREYGK